MASEYWVHRQPPCSWASARRYKGRSWQNAREQFQVCSHRTVQRERTVSEVDLLAVSVDAELVIDVNVETD